MLPLIVLPLKTPAIFFWAEEDLARYTRNLRITNLGFHLLISGLIVGARAELPRNDQSIKSLLTPLFLMGCFPVDFQEVKRPLRTKSGKRPIKVGKRPIEEGKRPIKAMALVGISVGCLVGCFRAPPPWRNTAPLKKAH